MSSAMRFIAIIALMSTTAHSRRVKTKSTSAESAALLSSLATEAAEGEVETALLLAKAHLEDELVKQKEKKKHAEEEAAGYRKELIPIEEAINHPKCKFFGWFMDYIYDNYCKHLKESQHPFLAETLRQVEKDLGIINEAIAKLTAEVAQKLTDAAAARAEEELLVKLNAEAENLQKRQEATEEANAKMEKVEKEKNDKKIAAFDLRLQNLTDSLKTLKSEYALLTEEHTSGICAEKEAKGENICKRCTNGKACGDTCISSTKHCWYDPGCSCMEGEASASLLQADAGTSEEEDAAETIESAAHPLRKKLNQARAQLRKVMYAQKGVIGNLEAQLATSQQDIADANAAKAAAIMKFTAEVAQAKDTREQFLTELTKEKEVLEAHSAKFASTTENGEKALEELAAQLKEDMKLLESDLLKTEHDKMEMIDSNKASMNALKDTHSFQINDIKVEISSLWAEIDSARKKLANIKSQHGVP